MENTKQVKTGPYEITGHIKDREAIKSYINSYGSIISSSVNGNQLHYTVFPHGADKKKFIDYIEKDTARMQSMQKKSSMSDIVQESFMDEIEKISKSILDGATMSRPVMSMNPMKEGIPRDPSYKPEPPKTKTQFQMDPKAGTGKMVPVK
jgi:hypothetical protein